MGIDSRASPLVSALILFLPRNFSNGESVDAVETEKSRIVLHELETGWWILAVRCQNSMRFGTSLTDLAEN